MIVLGDIGRDLLSAQEEIRAIRQPRWTDRRWDSLFFFLLHFKLSVHSFVHAFDHPFSQKMQGLG
jgi:hypothetical protein